MLLFSLHRPITAVASDYRGNSLVSRHQLSTVLCCGRLKMKPVGVGGWQTVEQNWIGAITQQTRIWWNLGVRFLDSFKYLGVLFTCERRMDCEIDRRIGAAAAVMQSLYRSVVVKRELSRKAKLSILPVSLRSCPHLWSWTLGHDRKNKIQDTSDRNEFPPQGGGALP